MTSSTKHCQVGWTFTPSTWELISLATDMPDNWNTVLTLLRVRNRTHARTLESLDMNGIRVNNDVKRCTERHFKRLAVLRKCSSVSVEVQQVVRVDECSWGLSRTKLLQTATIRMPQAGENAFARKAETTWHLPPEQATADQLQELSKFMDDTELFPLFSNVHLKRNGSSAKGLEAAWSGLRRALDHSLFLHRHAVVHRHRIKSTIGKIDTASFFHSSRRTDEHRKDIHQMKELTEIARNQEREFDERIMAGSMTSEKEKLMQVLELVWQYISSVSKSVRSSIDSKPTAMTWNCIVR